MINSVENAKRKRFDEFKKMQESRVILESLLLDARYAKYRQNNKTRKKFFRAIKTAKDNYWAMARKYQRANRLYIDIKRQFDAIIKVLVDLPQEFFDDSRIVIATLDEKNTQKRKRQHLAIHIFFGDKTFKDEPHGHITLTRNGYLHYSRGVGEPRGYQNFLGKSKAVCL